MKPPPAFQLYAQDFLVGTADMTAEQVGAYIRLLCYQWVKNGLPNDPAKLAALAGCHGIAAAMPLHKFGLDSDGLLRNHRLEQIRNTQRDYRAKQAEKGKKRWEKSQTLAAKEPRLSHGSNPAGAGHEPEACSSSSSSKYIKQPAGCDVKPRERNPLFDALAQIEGSDVTQLTAPAARRIGVALANIKRAFPDVTTDEIFRRAEAYRKLMPTATLTASGLAGNWARCVPGAAAYPGAIPQRVVKPIPAE